MLWAANVDRMRQTSNGNISQQTSSLRNQADDRVTAFVLRK